MLKVLTDKIEGLGEELRTHFKIDELSPVSLPMQVHTISFILIATLFFRLISIVGFYLQDTVSVLGQVCCDSNGKLNAQSVLLEASREHGARQVPVDLSELQEYSLFPGQVSRRILTNHFVIQVV